MFPQGSPGLQFWPCAACPVWFRSGPSVRHTRLRLGEHAPLLEAPRSLVAAFALGSPNTTATPHVSTCGPLWPRSAPAAAWPPPPPGPGWGQGGSARHKWAGDEPVRAVTRRALPPSVPV